MTCHRLMGRRVLSFSSQRETSNVLSIPQGQMELRVSPPPTPTHVHIHTHMCTDTHWHAHTHTRTPYTQLGAAALEG